MKRESEFVTLRFQKSHVYLAGALLVGFGGGMTVMGLLRSRGPEPSQTSLPLASPSSDPIEVATEGRPYRGPPDAPVTVVEFTDYECPYCVQHFRQTYRELLSRYDGELRYVVRNFPVRMLHPHARRAAVAAECAHEQGRFWEYHDLLFEHSPALDRGNLSAYAEEASLDVGAFEDCLDSDRMTEVVERDLMDGIGYGVTGTPTFFINGRRVVGLLTTDQFVDVIEAALADVSTR